MMRNSTLMVQGGVVPDTLPWDESFWPRLCLAKIFPQILMRARQRYARWYWTHDFSRPRVSWTPTDPVLANSNPNIRACLDRISLAFEVDAPSRFGYPQMVIWSEASIEVVLRWLEINVTVFSALDWSSMDPTMQIWYFSFMKLWFLLRRSLRSSDLRIECEIIEIVGIKIRFPQTAPLFGCETINGNDCGNYDGRSFWCTTLLWHRES